MISKKSAWFLISRHWRYWCRSKNRTRTQQWTSISRARRPRSHRPDRKQRFQSNTRHRIFDLLRIIDDEYYGMHTDCIVDPDNQTIILPASFLNTLALGEHSFEAYFTEPDSGSAKATSGTVSIAVMTGLMIAVWSVIRKSKKEK